jgi:hypothetical protein
LLTSYSREPGFSRRAMARIGLTHHPQQGKSAL